MIPITRTPATERMDVPAIAPEVKPLEIEFPKMIGELDGDEVGEVDGDTVGEVVHVTLDDISEIEVHFSSNFRLPLEIRTDIRR